METYTPPTPEEEQAAAQQIEDLLNERFELELNIEANNFAKKQTLEAALNKLGVRREDINTRIFIAVVPAGV